MTLDDRLRIRRAASDPQIDVPNGVATSASFDARRHTVRTGRTRKGRTTQEVTHYGSAHIVGSWTTGADGALTPEHAYHLAEITSARRGVFGWSAYDVSTVTDAHYGNDAELEPVLGSEVRAYAQITPPRTGVAHDVDADGNPVYGDWSSADECAVARHRTDMMAELPHGAMIAGVKADALEDERDHHASVKSWPTRYKLANNGVRGNGHRTIRHGERGYWQGRRKADPRPTRQVWANGYHLTGATLLTSPSDDPERVFVGWSAVTRPTPVNGVLGHSGKRTRVRKAKRTVEHVDAATIAELVARFGTLERGQRVTWTTGRLSGAMTRASDGRLSMTGDAVAKSVRTLDAILRKLELAAA